jgi:hypothetical protein
MVDAPGTGDVSAPARLEGRSDGGAPEEGWSAIVQRHQGLDFRAPFPLGVRSSKGLADVDVEVVIGATKPVGQDAPGPVVAELKSGGRSFYTAYRAADGYLVRFHGTCEMHVSADGRRVVCEPGPGCDQGLLGVLVAGTGTALLLTLRGHAVLHGSAVRLGGQTVLFAGWSGKGKTTMAALCCASGAELVCDDVVTLVSDGGQVSCMGLGNELRLREVAAGIADLFPPPGPPRRRTADGRLAIRPARASEEVNAISAVVVPQPSREATAVTIKVVPPPTAAVALLGNARVPAMVPLDLQTAYFTAVADLVSTVPVVEATVPWGPPWATSVVAQLMDALAAL